MGIEDIQISEELETNAPSIKYSGDEGPKSPQQMQEMMMAQVEEEYSKYLDDMIEQGLDPMSFEQFLDQAMAEGQMSGGTPLPNDPTKPVNPFQPKPTGPVLPDRQMAAYGGIMGVDGRKQYGIGSWFQENVMDNYKKFTGQTQEKIDEDSQKRVDQEDKDYGKNYENPLDTFLKGERGEDDEGNETRTGGQAANILPAIGGAIAGLFTKKNEDGTSKAMTQDETALALADLKKTANVLDQKQAMAANLNFTPSVDSRKYKPSDMIEVYQNAANGGRIGFDNGGGIINPFSELETFQLKGLGYDVAGKGVEPFGGVEVLKDILRVNQQRPYAMGGRIGFEEGGGIMDLGGMEKDYRAEGGFVPIGREEKADDVPARLSVNEFVFTADAVRNAGGGDIDQGAQVMENMMKHLEQGGQVSEESQGMQGARDMFATSQRLGEVI
jgi:hypothetical protein